MDPGASLSAWLERLRFTDLSADQVTARLIDAVAEWGSVQGWRVYRRAPSVVTLPPPMERQHSVLDVALARPDGPPVVVEVDYTDRRRTLDKLVAEARAGRVPLWVRWGPGPLRAPEPPVVMVGFEVTRRGRLNSRAPQLAPPAHGRGVAGAQQIPIVE